MWAKDLLKMAKVNCGSICFSVPEYGHFCHKCQSLRAQKWHLGCSNVKTKTTFISPTSPKIIGIAFGFKGSAHLDGFRANF